MENNFRLKSFTQDSLFKRLSNDAFKMENQ